MISREQLRALLAAGPLARRARLLRFNWIARAGGAHQAPSSVIAGERESWARARAQANGPRVLIANMIGGHFALGNIDRMLAMALTLRGARVEAALCDAAAPACQMAEYALTPSVARFAARGPDPLLCDYCAKPAMAAWAGLDLPIRLLSRCVTA